MCTLQNSIFFPCSAAVRHARVGQKMSGVNDAELLYLEGLSRNVTENSHVLCPESGIGCHVLSHVHITQFRPHKIDYETTKIHSLRSIIFSGIPIGGYNSSLK